MEKFNGKIIAIEKIEDIRIIKILPEKTINYKPGQFFRLWGVVNNSLMFRPYSAASPPNYPYLEFVIKIVENGRFTKGFIDKLNVGDIIELDGPFGSFTLNENVSSILFAAAGVGIAPIMSMLRYLNMKEKKPTSILYYTTKSPSKTAYLSEILSYSWLEKHITFTKEKTEHFRFGRFNQADFEKINSEIAYICGGKSFGAMVKNSLKNVKNIKTELWG